MACASELTAEDQLAVFSARALVVVCVCVCVCVCVGALAGLEPAIFGSEGRRLIH